MPRHSPYTRCERCGLMRAGGGQRFCWSCIVDILFGTETISALAPKPRKPRTPRPCPTCHRPMES